MKNLILHGLFWTHCAVLLGCASSQLPGISAPTRDEAAVVVGEGLGVGSFFKDVVPGASRVLGSKAPGVVSELSIEKVNNNPISPTKDDEYWLVPGQYQLEIGCGFKDGQGYTRGGDGAVAATLEKGRVYKIEGKIKVTGKDFFGRDTYACDANLKEVTTRTSN